MNYTSQTDTNIQIIKRFDYVANHPLKELVDFDFWIYTRRKLYVHFTGPPIAVGAFLMLKDELV
jgi:hypothetical protein